MLGHPPTIDRGPARPMATRPGAGTFASSYRRLCSRWYA